MAKIGKVEFRRTSHHDPQFSPKIFGHFRAIFGLERDNFIFGPKILAGRLRASCGPYSGSFNQLTFKICGLIWAQKWLGYIRAFSSIIILEAARKFSGQIVGRIPPEINVWWRTMYVTDYKGLFSTPDKTPNSPVRRQGPSSRTSKIYLKIVWWDLYDHEKQVVRWWK